MHRILKTLKHARAIGRAPRGAQRAIGVHQFKLHIERRAKDLAKQFALKHVGFSGSNEAGALAHLMERLAPKFEREDDALHARASDILAAVTHKVYSRKPGAGVLE